MSATNEVDRICRKGAAIIGPRLSFEDFVRTERDKREQRDQKEEVFVTPDEKKKNITPLTENKYVPSELKEALKRKPEQCDRFFGTTRPETIEWFEGDLLNALSNVDDLTYRTFPKNAIWMRYYNINEKLNYTDFLSPRNYEKALKIKEEHENNKGLL